jgi:hypothetical protein
VRLCAAVDEQREARRREHVGLELDAGVRHACIVPRSARSSGTSASG